MAIYTPTYRDIKAEKLISSLRPGDMLKLDDYINELSPRLIFIIKIEHNLYHYLRMRRVYTVSRSALVRAAAQDRLTLIGGGDHEQI